jgi:hypothetical protein
MSFDSALIDDNDVVRVLVPGTQGIAGPAARTGTIIQSVDPVVPAGWLECDGQTVSRTTYAALWAIASPLVPAIFGAGNGTTTFTLPDYSGDAIGAGVLVLMKT